jgi:hypothetical protein
MSKSDGFSGVTTELATSAPPRARTVKFAQLDEDRREETLIQQQATAAKHGHRRGIAGLLQRVSSLTTSYLQRELPPTAMTTTPPDAAVPPPPPPQPTRAWGQVLNQMQCSWPPPNTAPVGSTRMNVGEVRASLVDEQRKVDRLCHILRTLVEAGPQTSRAGHLRSLSDLIGSHPDRSWEDEWAALTYETFTLTGRLAPGASIEAHTRDETVDKCRAAALTHPQSWIACIGRSHSHCVGIASASVVAHRASRAHARSAAAATAAQVAAHLWAWDPSFGGRGLAAAECGGPALAPVLQASARTRAARA